MTDPATVALVVLAGGIGLLAGYLQWPTAPALDGERWFKVTLASLLLGQTDAEGGSEEQWIERVKRWVPYHPAGRLPERKVVQPLADPPGERLPGELALQEKLATLDGAEARWAWMYDTDPLGVEARLVDPFELGSSYDPEQLVGPGHGWDALATWGSGDPAFRDALLRRVHARFALFEGRPERMAGPALGDALQAELPELLRIPFGVPFGVGDVDAQVEAARAVLMEHAPKIDDRLVLFAEEAGATVLLHLLQSDVGMRDRLLAVVTVGGVILGRPGEDGPFGEKRARDWMDAWFTLERFDSELVRLTPFLSVQWLDRGAATPGAAGLPLEAQRFPEPKDDGSIATLEVVDLGPLEPASDPPLDQVARALIATACLWTLSRA